MERKTQYFLLIHLYTEQMNIEAFCEAVLEQRRAVVCMWFYATCLAIWANDSQSFKVCGVFFFSLSSWFIQYMSYTISNIPSK